MDQPLPPPQQQQYSSIAPTEDLDKLGDLKLIELLRLNLDDGETMKSFAEKYQLSYTGIEQARWRRKANNDCDLITNHPTNAARRSKILSYLRTKSVLQTPPSWDFLMLQQEDGGASGTDDVNLHDARETPTSFQLFSAFTTAATNNHGSHQQHHGSHQQHHGSHQQHHGRHQQHHGHNRQCNDQQ